MDSTVLTVITTIGGIVLGGIISWVIAAYYFNRSEISYQIISTAPVVKVSHEAKQDVEVYYRGERYNDVSVVVLKLWNSGNQPIRGTDIVTHPTFTFGQAKLLQSDTLKMEPPQWLEGMSGTAHHLTFAIALMNPKDSITLKLLLADYDGVIMPQSRIAGISKLREVPTDGSESITPRRLLLNALLLFVSLAAVIAVSALLPLLPSSINTATVIAVAAALVGVIVGFTSSLPTITLAVFRYVYSRMRK